MNIVNLFLDFETSRASQKGKQDFQSFVDNEPPISPEYSLLFVLFFLLPSINIFCVDSPVFFIRREIFFYQKKKKRDFL